ncbi:Rab1a [Hexamita inflata]|uniref:Rab1a n=1 Tax=Hexamita inflata TaxID=28002 RepID=A0ABP1IT21_9EUKA
MAQQEMKIVVLGDASVGKSSILYRYVSDSFNQFPASTINASFYRKLLVSKIPTNLQLWDTASQEKFKSIIPMYYRNADIIIIVFSVDSISSFNQAKIQVEEVLQKQEKPNIILLGNKCDLHNSIKNEAEDYAQEAGYKLHWVSALNGQGVKQAFTEAVEDVLNKQEFKMKTAQSQVIEHKQLNVAKKELKTGCCK